MTKEELKSMSKEAIPYDSNFEDPIIIAEERCVWREGFTSAIKLIKEMQDLPNDISKFIDEHFWELI